MSHVLRIGAVDWRHPGWVGGFYPDSLPEDWWLTYYSNEFDCVLVPAAVWRAAAPEQWCRDTPDEFRFYLRLGAADAAEVAALLRCGAALGSRFGGTLADAHAAPELLERLAALGPIYRDAAAGQTPAGCCWRPDSRAQGCALGILTGAERPDRRALSAQIQGFCAQVDVAQGAVLFIDGTPPPVGMLQDAGVIAGLLGF